MVELDGVVFVMFDSGSVAVHEEWSRNKGTEVTGWETTTATGLDGDDHEVVRVSVGVQIKTFLFDEVVAGLLYGECPRGHAVYRTVSDEGYPHDLGYHKCERVRADGTPEWGRLNPYPF
ncbi:hypothetical protein BSZ37_11160 [Rubrivirga marina]|uniref:Uncharacterized protein n=2 Tax=Rubrivirga marina TaxID=1196024 RepID=A0A271J0R0_9BACT|nr:hypothetical protein BSZ37_11160 [Rubrivirga marina]